MGDTVSVTGKCVKCGGPATWRDGAADHDRVTCGKCGMDLGSYGEFAKRAVDGVKKKLDDEIRKAFGGSRTIKINI